MVLPALNEVHLESVYRNLEEVCYSSRTIFQNVRLLWKYLQHLVYGIVGAGVSLLPITNRHLAWRWSTLEYDDTLDNGTEHSFTAEMLRISNCVYLDKTSNRQNRFGQGSTIWRFSK